MSNQDLKSRLEELRSEMTGINSRILNELNRFFQTSNEIGVIKEKLGLPYFDPARESQMLQEVLQANKGPLPSDLVKRLFNEVFKTSVELMGKETKKKLQVQRMPESCNVSITLSNGCILGGQDKAMIAGPCAVENQEQMDETAQALNRYGVRILRGGAFKPRTSPYSFQGLEIEGLKLLRQTADRYGMAVITEVMSIQDIEPICEYADILQVGTRNMFNYSLLKELGKAKRPVFLKRGFMATLEEFILAAEYIHLAGNPEIILCERGIRTFETQTRNTLDISAVPILKRETILPVIVDVSHALGRKDILAPIAKASLAAGADGLMMEAHYNPSIAWSDYAQQLDPNEMDLFFNELKKYMQQKIL